MDFEIAYTPEQESFRKDVRAFLEEHVPKDTTNPMHPDSISRSQYLKRWELGKKMGQLGWLFPTYPKEYGGGGFSIDHAIVIEEELDRYDLSLPPFGSMGVHHFSAAVLAWGTPEQKRSFLPPVLRGEKRTWDLLTEPSGGSDLASITTAAVRHGDEYVINGQKTFVGVSHGGDLLWTITRTDPDGKRHENLSWFIIPADAPGVSMAAMDLLNTVRDGDVISGEKYSVFFDNVRVPAFNLIGGENKGWKVANTHLESEHGGQGSVRRNRTVERFIEYCKTTQRKGQPLSKETRVRDLLVDCYVDAEVARLFSLRNYWLWHARQPRSYEGPQASMYGKLAGMRVAKAILKALGPYALTNDPAWDSTRGQLEQQQRGSIVALHPGGTVEVQKLVMARRIGVGRTTREEAGRLA